MTDTTGANKNDAANRAESTTDTRADVDGEGQRRGALDLEYPAGNGLYSDLFATFHPEVADELIDTHEVRMLVEMEYNARRLVALLDDLGVDEDVRVMLEECRGDIEGVLWAVCGELAADYSVGESVEWTPASEMF